MPLTCAVIEDEEDSRELLAALLEHLGHRAEKFAHGAAALTALRDGLSVDCIFLDLMMPVMNGWQFLEAVRADARLAGIPVLVVSASSNLQAERLEVFAEFEKPLDFRQVLGALARLADVTPRSGT